MTTYTCPLEHTEQVNFVNWMRYNHPKILIAAVPNGGKRSKKTASDLKAEGVSPGFPDLIIPELFTLIEMKRKKGSSTSKDQIDWHKYLRDCGYKVFVCKGCDEAKKVIISLLSDK